MSYQGVGMYKAAQEVASQGWVYVLLCEKEVYYVGWTQNVHKRLREHFVGARSRITREFKPQSVLMYFRGTYTDEDRVAKEFRRVLGDKVFGGPFGFSYLERESLRPLCAWSSPSRARAHLPRGLRSASVPLPSRIDNAPARARMSTNG